MATFSAYPIFLDVKGHPALVVGGGEVGLRKARGLMECGARVTVVSEAFDPDFKTVPEATRETAAYGGKHMKRRAWRLVFAATNVAAVNRRVQKDAAAAGILCCRCDDPEAGDFSGGAVVRLGDKGRVVLGVNTGGGSPVIGARICREAAENVDNVLVRWAEMLGVWRARVKALVANETARRMLLRRLAGEEMEKILRGHRGAAAEKLAASWIKQAGAEGAKGKVQAARRTRGRAGVAK